jgi:hypothetical protein
MAATRRLPSKTDDTWQLATWRERSAGLTGRKLTSAVSSCEAESIESVDDLQEVYGRGRLERLGFQQIALPTDHTEDALEGVPAPQRRMQDQEPGSSCVDVQAEIPRLWAQTGALLAHSQNAALPIGMITMWAGTTASLPACWAVCDGTYGT